MFIRKSFISIAIFAFSAGLIFCSCDNGSSDSSGSNPPDGVYVGSDGLMFVVTSGKVTRFKMTLSFTDGEFVTTNIDTTGSWDIDNMEIIGLTVPVSSSRTLKVMGGFDDSNGVNSVGISWVLNRADGTEIIHGQGYAELN